MRVAGFQARAEHEDLWFDDAPPFKAFQSGAISESEYLVGLAEFLGLTREQGGGRFASSPCLQGEVSAERSEDDGGGQGHTPPLPSPLPQGGEGAGSLSPREGEARERSERRGGSFASRRAAEGGEFPSPGSQEKVAGLSQTDEVDGTPSVSLRLTPPPSRQVEEVDLGRLVHNGILRGEYAGATELVQDIHARGWQSACLSNTNAIHWEVLTDPAYFPAVAALNHKLASHLLNLEKPSPAIYRHFEEATASDPTEIVFFDDLPANVEAARACGWSAHLIDHDGDTVAQMRAALGNMATWHR